MVNRIVKTAEEIAKKYLKMPGVSVVPPEDRLTPFSESKPDLYGVDDEYTAEVDAQLAGTGTYSPTERTVSRTRVSHVGLVASM